MLKIESGSSKDLFVGLNHAVGINSDNKEAHDMVTVVEMGGNGRSYSQSFLKAKLGSNNEYTVRNFRHQKDLVITVKEIKTNTVPGYADVWEVGGGNGESNAGADSQSHNKAYGKSSEESYE